MNNHQARKDYNIGMDHIEYLKKIGAEGGTVGGKSRSKAKVAAAVKNAAKARKARVRKYPKCPGYNNGAHRFAPDGCCYNPGCRKRYPNLRQLPKD